MIISVVSFYKNSLNNAKIIETQLFRIVFDLIKLFSQRCSCSVTCCDWKKNWKKSTYWFSLQRPYGPSSNLVLKSAGSDVKSSSRLHSVELWSMREKTVITQQWNLLISAYVIRKKNKNIKLLSFLGLLNIPTSDFFNLFCFLLFLRYFNTF